MGVIRAGGLVSGLDTNAIIDSMVAAAKEPIKALDNKKYLLNLEKSLYKEINTDLSALKTSLFNLRMESTFKSKNATSSNATAVNAEVGLRAQTGTHTVNVLQTAMTASMNSSFVNASLSKTGAGVSRLAGVPTVYDKEEGTFTTSVYTSTEAATSGKSISYTQFVPSDGSIYTMLTPVDSSNNIVNIDSSFVDANGEIDLTALTAPDNELEFKITVGSEEITVLSTTLDDPTITDINTLFSFIENEVNAGINNALGTSYEQYVAMRPIYDDTTGSWSTGIYYTADYDLGLEATAGGLGDKLGLDETMSSMQTTGIVKYIVADNKSDLQAKLEDPLTSVLFTTRLEFGTGGLQDGTFEIIQDASMNVKSATKTRITSGVITDTIDITAPLATSGLNISLVNGMAGAFTINGKTITIEDPSTVSINDIMAMVNSSGAGVTMSFDAANGQFMLQSNAKGATNIALAPAGDTSNFLELFRLGEEYGSTLTYGSDGGKLDITAKINQSGHTYGIASGVFTINDVPIYIDSTKDSFQSVMDKINSSAAGVKISYDQTQDKFKIVGDSAVRIKFGGENDTSNILVAMGFMNIPNQPQYNGTAGRNAIVVVDGETFHRDSNKISDILDDVTLNLTGTGISTIEIDVDTDKAVDAMASFIKGYNSLVSKLKLGAIDKDDKEDWMTPLTDEKRDTMSDKEIEEYEGNYDRLHKQDIILKSSAVRALLKDIRSDIMDSIPTSSSEFKNLSQLGFEIAGQGDITITSKGFLLTLSEDMEEIKTAIRDNTEIMTNFRTKSDEVYKFFGDYEEVTNPSTQTTTLVRDSWVNRYETTVGDYQDMDGYIGIKVKIDNELDKQIKRIDDNIATQTRRAEDYLERLWAQFAAMEQRIAQSQNYGNAIAGLSGGGSAAPAQ